MGARRSRWVARWAAATAAAALVLLTPGAASAAGDSAITHVETTGSGIDVLVQVPGEVTPDLSGVKVTIGGTTVDAKAQKASGTTSVRRVSVLTIDVSNSMRGARFAAAKQAARAYLESVPADVAVGIVTFASEVTAALQPTTDRAQATAVLDSLKLSKQTRLYEGVEQAVALAGTEGQRSLLVLSDGADTTDTELDGVLGSISGSGVLVDVVSLDAEAVADPLARIATAGNGRVVVADSEDLRATFAAEAEVLSRQVLVSAPLPEGFTDSEATVTVTLPTDGETLEAEAFTQVRAAGSTTSLPAPPPSAWVLPSWAMWVGVATVGLGLLVALVMMVLSLTPKQLTAAERVVKYTDGSGAAQEGQAQTDSLANAKQAAAQVLKRNATLDEKISRRLEAAGSELRSSEWLVVHTAIVIGMTLLGALIGGGGLLTGVFFLVLGVIGPWMYLGFKRGRRLKAFNAALPDTLQLMSGSLAAGLSLAQSVDTIVREGSEPMAGEFKRVLIETRLGVPLEDALEGINDRFDSKDFAWVVMAIKIQRQVGGNLAELLDTVAATIREREYLRRQVAALSAEGKMSAWVLGLLPPLFLVYLMISQPDYVKPMFSEPLGWLMLLGAATMLAVGAFWMSRLVKVDV